MLRYRFGEFVLSPRRRQLLRNGREEPLIPRYFDLLVFLVERRHEAVHRREIFDRIWQDVIVSDSALSQAIRTIRRALDDDPKDPRFLRTVSRHGYRFVFPEVVEEEDDAGWPEVRSGGARTFGTAEPSRTSLLRRLARPPAGPNEEEEQREAAELLHAMGTAAALQALEPGAASAYARALLRDTRWDVPDAGPVPIAGTPAALSTAWALIRLRFRRARSIVTSRWTQAAAGGGVAGAMAGAAGGLILAVVPHGHASLAVVPVLALIGGGCGYAGAAGVGAGLAVAESVMRSRRALVLIAGAAMGGGLVGTAVQWLGRWSLSALVGVDIQTGGGLEGVAIGAAAGAGYAIATARATGGLAAPRGRRRLAATASTAAICGLAGLVLAVAGRPLVGGTIHLVAQASVQSQVALTALARLLGEPEFGPLTSALIATGEAAVFGLGLTLGLTRRPSAPHPGAGTDISRTSHTTLTRR